MIKRFLYIFIFCLLCSPCFAGGVLFTAGGVADGGGPILVYDLPCTDNAASTVVTNTVGPNWLASINTDTFSDGGSSFKLDANGDNISSPANWTAEKFTVRYDFKLDRAVATSTETTMGMSNTDSSFNAENQWMLARFSSEQFVFRASGNTDADHRQKFTTDFSGDLNWHEGILTVDASVSPWDVVLQVCDEDGTSCITISWGAWDTNPVAAVLNDTFYIGDGGDEPEASYKDIRIYDDE